MSEAKKVKIISDILGSYYRTSDELLFQCPKCEHHKRKLSVNLEKDAFKCWVCDYRGRKIYHLIRRYGDYAQKKKWNELTNSVDISSFMNLFEEYEVIEKKQIVDLPAEFKTLATKNRDTSSLAARAFLKSRGITREDIIRWKIGFCTSGAYRNRIIIPSFGLDGRCNYFVGRAYEEDSWKKYYNPPASKNIIFNDLYIDWGSDLVLVEGIFDAIVAGPNSIPLLGSTLREESELFQKIIKNDTPVYLALDPDVEKKTIDLIAKLLLYGIEIYKIQVKPYSDVGEMTKEEFKKRKENAVLVNETNYLLSRISFI
mgnify:FL=1